MIEQQFGPRAKTFLLYGCAAALAAVANSGTAVTLTAQSVAAPTFNRDVAQILYEKCATCHRPDAGGPMMLTSFSGVRPWGRAIKASVTRREMPPWSADPRFGDYMNDISLTRTQIETIATWVDAGMPEGSGPAPALPKYPDGGWRLVNGRGPDVILEMPMEYELPSEGQVPVFRVWDKNPFKEDVFIQALQIRPTNPAVTHHSALTGRKLPEGTTLQKGIGWKNGPELAYIPTYADGSIVSVLTAGSSGFEIEGVEGRAELKPGDRVPTINKSRPATEEDDERLMFYLPGADFQLFPEGSAKRIRASNALMWEVHYSPDGKPETDRERIGLWIAKTKPQHEVHVIRNGSGQHIIENGEVGSVANLPPIPPGAADWKITAIQPFTEDVTLATMQPHMHLRGKDMTYVATYPDGREEILLSVPKYDFNWQNTYVPVKPFHLPAGTVLKTVGHYDNSVRNRMNPQPNRPALWSEQTWDEMFNAFTEITYDGETEPSRSASEARERSQAASKNNPITTVVGCAAPGTSPLVWKLAGAARVATPSVKSGESTPQQPRVSHDISKEERELAASQPPGNDLFELIGVADFVAPEQTLSIETRKTLYPLARINSTGVLAPNRRVAAKGVFIPGTPARINLTSVVLLNESCSTSPAN